MNHLIVGAGYTGRRVAAHLPPERTWVTRRQCREGDGNRWTALDLDAPDPQLSVPPAPWSLLYTVPPAADTHGDPRLTRCLAALSGMPRRIVYVSTSGVYGDRAGASTDESAPIAPRTARARRRAAAEEQLSAWCTERQVALFVLRVAAIYGPGRLGLPRIKAGAALLRDADATPGNRIHVDDLAHVCVNALTVATEPGIYNIADGDHRSATEFSSAVAKLAGLPEPPRLSLAEAQTAWSPARLAFAAESRRLDTQKMRRVLGVTPRYTNPEDGIRASLVEGRNGPDGP